MTQLQPLLGLDKSSPLIEVLIDPCYPDEALVHFGTRLLERVRLGKDSVEAKLLAGRLYNAGFKRKTLTDEFLWDLKTIRGYGDALKSGSAEALARALAGQGALRKIDEDLELFIRETFRRHYEEKGCHSNSFIREKLEQERHITVSHETVRPIIKDELAKMFQKELTETDAVDTAIPPAGDARSDDVIRDSDCKNAPSSASEFSKNCKYSPSLPKPATALPTVSSINDNRQRVLLHHGGLLLVRALIDGALDGLGSMHELIRQWTAAILCGCVNIEQMGALNYPSLEIIIGPQLNAVSGQREMLLKNASVEVIADVRRCNLSFLGLEREPRAFLYDPHGIEYTGQLKLLKGWLGGSHQVGKAYYQDFIHTLDGRPMVAFLDDNRSTLLKRLPGNVSELRSLLDLPTDSPITLTVDRAVYSLPDLLHYRDNLNIHVITWEKNCTRPPWEPTDEQEISYLYIPKFKNHSRDVITYKAEYYSQPWSRDQSVNQYTLRLHKGPETDPITLSILSTCPDDIAITVPAQLESILTRWVQENNIGYLITHNGINEITSYQSYSYEQAAAKLDLDDYLTANPELRRLSTQKLKWRRKKAGLIIKMEDRTNFYDQDRQNKTKALAEVEDKLTRVSDREAVKELKKHRASLRRSLKTLPNRRQKFLDKTNRKIEEINQLIHEINDQCQAEPATVQRVEYLISREYKRLNFAPKALMDAIRLLAHNIHRHLHHEFRPIYDNYRNDHRILRELIQSPAFLEETPDDYRVTLIPSRLHGKTTAAIMTLINQVPALRTANGKPLRITLQAPLQGIQFAI